MPPVVSAVTDGIVQQLSRTLRKQAPKSSRGSNPSDMELEWTEAFQTLDADDQRLQKALDHGARLAQEEAKKAAERERQ